MNAFEFSRCVNVLIYLDMESIVERRIEEVTMIVICMQ